MNKQFTFLFRIVRAEIFVWLIISVETVTQVVGENANVGAVGTELGYKTALFIRLPYVKIVIQIDANAAPCIN